MDLDLMCISAKFSPEEESIMDAYCITTPVYGERYTLRDIVRNPDNTYGVLLREVHNVHSYICNFFLHYNSGEPNWPLTHFKVLNHKVRLKYKNLWEFYKDTYLRSSDITDVNPAIELIE